MSAGVSAGRYHDVAGFGGHAEIAGPEIEGDNPAFARCAVNEAEVAQPTALFLP